MPVIVLLRHGISSANTAGILAGHTPGVALTDTGVRALERTLRMLPHHDFARLLHSPLLRCEQTARLAQEAATFADVAADPDIIELDYGEWTGEAVADLALTPEWEAVQTRASSVRFPGGESIAEAADRAVARVRAIAAELAAEEADLAAASAPGEKPPRLWAMVVSHGDIIKAVIADALGLPLDDFQRLSVAPGSFTVLDFSGRTPVLSAMSVTAAGLPETALPGGGSVQEAATGQ